LSSKAIDRIIDRSEKLIVQGNPESAIFALRQVLETYPNNKKASKTLALAFKKIRQKRQLSPTITPVGEVWARQEVNSLIGEKSSKTFCVYYGFNFSFNNHFHKGIRVIFPFFPSASFVKIIKSLILEEYLILNS